MRKLEIYIHIPFCISKCKYCDFLSGPASKAQRQKYVEDLCSRIRKWKEAAKEFLVVSIFIGGGTPSILEPEQTRSIFEALRETFEIASDAEITTEMNPGTVTEEKLRTYAELGINRLSIGLQTTDNEELKCLGRIHTYEDFLLTYQMAREAGFQNINIDLMTAIPHQTMESYEDTLERIVALNPEHISAYSLIIEEGTPFYERYGEGRHSEELPDEDTERRMYVRTKEILKAHGYERYEISNYAKRGYECRHNLGYWDRTEYLGIGDGAASLMDHKRWNQDEEPVELTRQEEIEEFMFLGLRKIKGVSRKTFRETFGEDMDVYYGELLEKLVKEKLIIASGDRIALTDRGIDVSNYVLSQFLM